MTCQTNACNKTCVSCPLKLSSPVRRGQLERLERELTQRISFNVDRLHMEDPGMEEEDISYHISRAVQLDSLRLKVRDRLGAGYWLGLESELFFEAA